MQHGKAFFGHLFNVSADPGRNELPLKLSKLNVLTFSEVQNHNVCHDLEVKFSVINSKLNDLS